MKLDVPYYSQKKDIVLPTWRDRACGITALKMVLEFCARKKHATAIPQIDTLIKEGEKIGAYTPPFGWSHEGLVRIAHNHGFPAHKEEWRSQVFDTFTSEMKKNSHEYALAEMGVQKIFSFVKEGNPTIVSIARPPRADSHMVVLTGVEEDKKTLNGFYYHDPEAVDKEKGKHIFVDIDTFKREWRKMAIFINK